MSKHQHIRVRGVRRRKVDASKLGRALIALAQAQAEKEAQDENEARRKREERKRDRRQPDDHGSRS